MYFWNKILTYLLTNGLITWDCCFAMRVFKRSSSLICFSTIGMSISGYRMPTTLSPESSFALTTRSVLSALLKPKQYTNPEPGHFMV